MKWEQYRQTYANCEVGLNQTVIVTRASLSVLRNYPNDLPSPIRRELNQGFAELTFGLAQALKEAGQKMPPEMAGLKQSLPKKRKKPKDSVYADLFAPTLWILLTTYKEGKGLNHMDFTRVVCEQQLTMTFAYLDAFCADTIRTILKVRPDILKTNKQMDWKTALALGNWDSLVEHMMESYVYDFGWSSVAERMTAFEDRLGVEMRIAPKDISRMEQAELIRNVVMHNGGRASGEYLKRSGDLKLKIGDQVPLDLKFANEVTDLARMFASKLFRGVSEAHFKIKRESITGVPLWKDDQAHTTSVGAEKKTNRMPRSHT